jgi:hypothetical protein
MNAKHRAIRNIIKEMPLLKAREIIKPHLPERQFIAIYYADVCGKNLRFIGDCMPILIEKEYGYTPAESVMYSEQTVKSDRRKGYGKLADIIKAGS